MSATIETVPWNIQDHIQSPERQIGYLEAALEDGDPALITTALGDIAKARGMATVAKEAGVTREGLYKALSSTGDPRLSSIMGVLKALGLTLSVRQTPKAI